mgnify:CR=1 FL=1
MASIHNSSLVIQRGHEAGPAGDEVRAGHHPGPVRRGQNAEHARAQTDPVRRVHDPQAAQSDSARAEKASKSSTTMIFYVFLKIFRLLDR